MGRHRGNNPKQSNKLDTYTVTMMTHGGQMCTPVGVDRGQSVECVAEPSLREIKSAIQDLKGTLEPKLDTVTIDVGLLQAEMEKISEKVTKVEENINGLQATTKQLKEQVAALM
ncbi:hypothetical protein NDU88_003054 [Pleurodeles waltl]|uniref:Uncharacterized protein n=1 Tax=Pleurodeles waltl TaxID=8319 RepID=A0AAV7KTT2_PLEWA|nr:hypothetical protein NDU88_003054 [Pleurodeles waltl]